MKLRIKIVVLSLLLPLGTYLMAQEVVLEENFDSPEFPTTWKFVDNDQNSPNQEVSEYIDAWIITADPEDATNYVVSSTSYFTPINRADRWLISPEITLGDYGNYLSWIGMSYDPSFPDSYKVMISTTGDEIDDFTDTLALISDEQPYWGYHFLELEEYNNQTIRLAFVNTTFDGFKLYLDSIKVRKNDPLFVLENNVEIKIYPNPIKDFITISSDAKIHRIEMTNQLGQKVVTLQNIDALSTTISISHLPEGVYLSLIYTVKGVLTRKIVK